MNRHTAPILVLLSICLLACGGVKIDSRWPDRGLVIDGDDRDWEGLKLYVRDWPVDIGIANDADFLYLNLSTSDRALQRQVIMRGFEVWLDPGGGRDRIVGVRYPVGMTGRDRESFGAMGVGQDGSARGDWRGSRSRGDATGDLSRAHPEQLQEAFERMLAGQQPVLLGKGRQEIRAVNMSGENDVRVMVTFANGRLVYEARFPLHGQYPLPPLPEDEGKGIGLGFRTRELDRTALQARGDDDFTGKGGLGGGVGGFGGPGVGLTGGRSGTFGGRRPSPFSPTDLAPIEEWTRITLARSATD